MSKRFLSTIAVPSLSSPPSEGHSGTLYFNTQDKTLHVHDGTQYIPVSVDMVKEMFLGGKHEGIDVKYDIATETLGISIQASEYSREPSGFADFTSSVLEWNDTAKLLIIKPVQTSIYLYRGQYLASYPYAENDVVIFNNSYYSRTSDSVGQTNHLPTNTTYWSPTPPNYSPDKFVIFANGIKFEKPFEESIDIPTNISGAIPGKYYLYYDGLGQLQRKTTPFDIRNDNPVAIVVIGTDGNTIFVGEERHGMAMDWATHYYLHKVNGTQHTPGGFAAGNYTTSGDGSLNSHAQFSLTGGTIFDQDNEFIISHNTNPTAEGQQHLEPFLKTRVLYRSGNGWKTTATQNYAFRSVTNIPQYSSLNAGSWSDAQIDNNKYFVSYVVATNNILCPILALEGQTQYNNLNNAKDTASFSTLDLAGLPADEWVALYRVIYHYNTSFTNDVDVSIVDVLDLKQTSSSGSGTASSTHANLIGLLDDDHTQYVHISNPRTIIASHTFNPTSEGPAFILGPNASGQLISGLNSEMVGGSTLLDINTTAFGYASSAKDDAIAASNGYTNTQFTNIDSYVAPLLTHTDHDGVSISWNNAANKITLNVEEPTKVESNPPSNPAQGDNWYDFETGVFYVYDGSFWVEVSGGNGAEAAALPSTVQYLEGTTSNIQNQLNSKAPINNPTLTGNVSLPSSTTLDGSALAKASDITPLAPKASPTFTGTVSLPSTTSIGNVSSTEIGYLDGVTSSIQAQINSKVGSNNPTLTGIVNLPSTTYIGTVTPVELGHLSGVSGNIQTALNGKLESSNFNTAAINVQVYSTIADLPAANINSGRIAYVSGESALYFAHNGAWTRLARFSDISTGGAAFSINELSDVDTASTAPQINNLLSWNGTNWVPVSPSAASGSAPSDSPTFTGTVTLPSTTSIGNVSSTEISYLDGVTSGIQSQINSKAPLASPIFTGTISLPSTTSIGSISDTEIGYLDGVTSSIQNQIDSKLSTSNFTYATITIPTYNQSANLPTASSNTGRVAYVTGETSIYYSNGSSWLRLAKASDLPSNVPATINDLTDVDTTTTTPMNGQVLAWNSTSSNWIPQTVSTGSTAIPTYPAITQLDVTNNGASSYQFNNQYTGDNPTIYAISGTTIAFKLNVTGHPFLVRTSGLTNFNAGLVHVATDGTISTGSSAQGKTSGTLYWQIPAATTGTYKYQCSIHSGMVGDIVIKDISLI